MSAATAGRRILVVSADRGHYGVGQWNRWLVDALRHGGHDAIAVLPPGDDGLDVGVDVLDGGDLWGPPEGILGFANHDDASELFGRWDPDLVVFSDGTPPASLAAKEAAMDARIPFVVVSHMATWPPRLADDRPALGSRVAASLRAADAWVCVAEHARRRLVDQLGLDADLGEVILNGRPAEFFVGQDPDVRAEVRAELQIGDDAVVVFTAARLDDAKGHADLLRMLGMLRKEPASRPVVLVWAGDGWEAPMLRRSVDMLRWGAQVRMLGARSDVARLLHGADISVLASHQETMPLAVIESMARAVPFVGTDVPGIREALHGTGMLVTSPVADPLRCAHELASAVRHLIDHPDVAAQMAVDQRAVAEQRYRADISAGRYLALVDQLADDGRTSPSSTGVSSRTRAETL